MGGDETSLYLLVIVAVAAVIGLGLSVASVASNESMRNMMGGGSMMGGSGNTAVSPPGPFEWGLLVISAGFFVAAVILLIRARGSKPLATGTLAPSLPAITPLPPQPIPPALAPTAAATVSTPPKEAISEPTLVKLLAEDERRMYLEIRDHGGQMLQRDLVALGVFSKAKVTRVLDKLEAKGIVVREAHGMTNRVRLVAK